MNPAGCNSCFNTFLYFVNSTAEEVMYENQIFIAGNKNFLQLINHTPESVKKYNNKDID
jgi:hypothetical protein